MRNAERGAIRGLGIPGVWTSDSSSAEGEETLRKLVSSACGGGSRLRSYSEEEAEAQERRARCFGTEPVDSWEDPRSRGRLKGEGQSPNEALPVVT